MLAGACDRTLPPAGQVVVFIDTDAIVPEGEVDAGRGAETRLSVLVDRARLEVLVDGSTLPNSTRDVAVDAAMLRDHRLSFGVSPAPHQTNVTVRVRLFRADRVMDLEPPMGVTLDSTISLPSVEEEGVVLVSVLLKADDFGARLGPLPATVGEPPPSLVNSWRGGQRVQCKGAPRPSETCVPGGAFFYGTPQLRGRGRDDIADERLAILSPYFIDTTEVTVADFRSVWTASLAGKVAEPVVKTEGTDPNFCTWTASATAGDVYPLNCVTWPTAAAYCAALGKELPSEAENEFIMSGVGEDWAFPWGNDEPLCSATVWGCAGIVTSSIDSVRRGSSACRLDRGSVGPLPPGRGLGDKIGAAVLRSAGGADILDLGGNLAEWTRDVWARASDPFWSSTTPLVDPVNGTPNPEDGAGAHAARGGDWASTVLTTRAGIRRFRREGEQSSLIGFRCKRADQP